MRGSSGLGSFMSICIEVSKVAMLSDGLHAPFIERQKRQSKIIRGGVRQKNVFYKVLLYGSKLEFFPVSHYDMRR